MAKSSCIRRLKIWTGGGGGGIGRRCRRRGVTDMVWEYNVGLVYGTTPRSDFGRTLVCTTCVRHFLLNRGGGGEEGREEGRRVGGRKGEGVMWPNLLLNIYRI